LWKGEAGEESERRKGRKGGRKIDRWRKKREEWEGRKRGVGSTVEGEVK